MSHAVLFTAPPQGLPEAPTHITWIPYAAQPMVSQASSPSGYLLLFSTALLPCSGSLRLTPPLLELKPDLSRALVTKSSVACQWWVQACAVQDVNGFLMTGHAFAVGFIRSANACLLLEMPTQLTCCWLQRQPSLAVHQGGW